MTYTIIIRGHKDIVVDGVSAATVATITAMLLDGPKEPAPKPAAPKIQKTPPPAVPTRTKAKNGRALKLGGSTDQVLAVLRKRKRPIKREAIVEKLNGEFSPDSVSSALNRLIKYGYIKRVGRGRYLPA
jgi:hypothetical protein